MPLNQDAASLWPHEMFDEEGIICQLHNSRSWYFSQSTRLPHDLAYQMLNWMCYKCMWVWSCKCVWCLVSIITWNSSTDALESKCRLTVTSWDVWWRAHHLPISQFQELVILVFLSISTHSGLEFQILRGTHFKATVEGHLRPLHTKEYLEM